MFKVQSYLFSFLGKSEIIEVLCTGAGGSKIVNIERRNFEFWLLRTGRLAWQITYHESKVHRIEEMDGTMSYREYWSSEVIDIKKDLHDYIFENKIHLTKKELR